MLEVLPLQRFLRSSLAPSAGSQWLSIFHWISWGGNVEAIRYPWTALTVYSVYCLSCIFQPKVPYVYHWFLQQWRKSEFSTKIKIQINFSAMTIYDKSFSWRLLLIDSRVLHPNSLLWYWRCWPKYSKCFLGLIVNHRLNCSIAYWKVGSVPKRMQPQQHHPHVSYLFSLTRSTSTSFFRSDICTMRQWLIEWLQSKRIYWFFVHFKWIPKLDKLTQAFVIANSID